MKAEKNCGCRVISRDEWIAEGAARFGIHLWKWIFKCPCCGEIFSCRDFINIGLRSDDAFQNCIGRFHKGRGCLCNLNQVEFPLQHGTRIRCNDGRMLEVFDFASQDEETAYLQRYGS